MWIINSFFSFAYLLTTIIRFKTWGLEKSLAILGLLSFFVLNIMYGLPVGLSKLHPDEMFKLVKAFELINIVSLLSLILLFVQKEPRRVHRRISIRLPIIAGLWAWYAGIELFLTSRVILVLAPAIVLYFFRKDYQLSWRASLYFSFFALSDIIFYHLDKILISEILFGISMIFYFKLINQILIKSILEKKLEKKEE